MNFSFASIFKFARTAISGVASGADAIAPIAAAIPGAGPIVAEVQIAAKVASEGVDAAEGLVSALTPELAQAEALIASLYHMAFTPGAIVLTPKTTVATISTTPEATKAATAAVQ